MLISDWISDVCSSDLHALRAARQFHARSQAIILWRRLVCGIEREIVAQREERVALLGEAGPGKVGEAKLCGVEAGWRQVALDVGVIIIGEIQARANTLARLPGATDLPREQRSEEHTSELQSLMRISYAVFCLKNKKH